jgi:hypothetical protein
MHFIELNVSPLSYVLTHQLVVPNVTAKGFQMPANQEFVPIASCPPVGDRIFIDDRGSMRAAQVNFCEDGQY